MKITVQAGWFDGITGLREFEGNSVAVAIHEAARYYPECLSGNAGLRENIAQVDQINGEGNYHDFIFRVVEIEP